MTPEQFELLADLLRSKGPAREAARMVLLQNYTNTDAARQAGVLPQSSSRTVRLIREMDQRISSVYELKQ